MNLHLNSQMWIEATILNSTTPQGMAGKGRLKREEIKKVFPKDATSNRVLKDDRNLPN